MKNVEKYLTLLGETADALLLTSRYSRHYGAEFDIAEGVAIVAKAGCRYFTDSRYIESYKMLPSLYAYRGYDTAMIFCGGMRSDIEYKMLDKRYTPLQTGYKFFQTELGGKYINREWVRINYNNNYSITLE